MYDSRLTKRIYNKLNKHKKNITFIREFGKDIQENKISQDTIILEKTNSDLQLKNGVSREKKIDNRSKQRRTWDNKLAEN